MDRLLLTAKEAGEAIGVGRTRIYELLATHELPTIRIGRSVRVSAKALEKWIEEKQKASTASLENNQ